MRSSAGMDQAEGLRRLLVGNRMRVVTVAAGKAGVGRTSVVVNLAAALVCSGKDVLVLDENPPPNNLPGQLRLPVRFDLLDVIQARCSLDDAILRGKVCSVLPAARAVRALQEPGSVERQRLEEALAGLGAVADVILVDAAMPALNLPGLLESKEPSVRGVVSPGTAMDASLLVVTDGTAAGITASYALIKRMALENACLRFGIAVNKAGSEQEAKTVFGNMAKVARRNLAARLDYLGYIPFDNEFVRATRLGRPVVEAFPAAYSAQSCMALAQELSHLPVSRDERDGGIMQMAQGLIMRVHNCRANTAGNVLTM